MVVLHFGILAPDSASKVSKQLKMRCVMWKKPRMEHSWLVEARIV